MFSLSPRPCPQNPLFNIFKVHSSSQPHTRQAMATTVEPCVQTNTIFVLPCAKRSPRFAHPSHPLKTAMVENTIETPRHWTPLLFWIWNRHSTLTQTARTAVDPTTSTIKGSRIERPARHDRYTLAPHHLHSHHPSHSKLRPHSNPGLQTRPPPFSPPPLIGNSVVRLPEHKPSDIDGLHPTLHPLTDIVHLFTEIIHLLPPVCQSVFSFSGKKSFRALSSLLERSRTAIPTEKNKLAQEKGLEGYKPVSVVFPPALTIGGDVRA